MRGLASAVVIMGLAFGFGVHHGTGLPLVSPAWAGGDGGNNASKPAPAKPEKKSGKKPAKKRAYVPDTDDLRAKEGPQARMHDRLEDYARGDSLKGLGTDLKRLKKFRKALDRLINRARTSTEKREAGQILSQLRRYREQTRNKELSANANRVLKSLAALDAHDRVVKAEKAFYKATLTGGNPVDDIETNEDYKDAVRDYDKARKAVPAVPRNQFERFDKTLLTN